MNNLDKKVVVDQLVVSPLGFLKFVLFSFLGILFLFNLPFFIVSPGYKGIIVRLGSVINSYDTGLHLKVPFIDSVFTINVQTQKEQVNAESASSDLQNVTTILAVNYSIDPKFVVDIYTKVGDFKTKLLDPSIQESVKAVTAKYTAEQLITKRAEVKDNIKSLLYNSLINNHILVSDVNIVNFDFSASFNSAIEAKVTAEQNALTAKNKLEQVKFEAEQKIATAKAEAEAIRIQAQAINSQGGADYVQLQAINKWNGILPTQMLSNVVPFVNVNK